MSSYILCCLPYLKSANSVYIREMVLLDQLRVDNWPISAAERCRYANGIKTKYMKYTIIFYST